MKTQPNFGPLAPIRYVCMYNLRKLCIFWYLLHMRTGQKFHLSARNSEWNLERTSIFSQGRISQGSHITPLCSLLHLLLKVKCMCLQDEWKLCYSSCKTSAILKYFCHLHMRKTLLNAHTDIFSQTNSINFCQSFLHPYFVYTCEQWRLWQACARCDKYPNFMYKTQMLILEVVQPVRESYLVLLRLLDLLLEKPFFLFLDT